MPTKEQLLETNDLLLAELQRYRIGEVAQENETLRQFLNTAGQQIERLTAALRQSNERNKELARLVESLTLQYEQQKDYIATLRNWATEQLIET
jgi:ABC-type transporter Mla subunit MlaD